MKFLEAYENIFRKFWVKYNDLGNHGAILFLKI